MARPMGMTPIRLHVEPPLSAGATIEAAAARAHYLGTVMRRSVGDAVRLFNGRDGEWDGRVMALSRGKATLLAETLVRPQHDEPDLWLVFALLKRDTTDMVVQKATELGVSRLLPVLTERTNAARVNADRLHAIAIEAAEQSERLTVPAIHAVRPLDQVLAKWSDQRSLYAALERDQQRPLPRVDDRAGLLVGPEGGFGARDRDLLSRHDFVRPVSLGRRILRAETAAIVGLALLQASSCG
ncbi:16S rRNA (uracil(1498)-N(3))-methyltransferase [Rhodopila sp.]|uniref:16S rRNA (uracil(1498)-N(3))-methyltransferase n=1 Tax=Rhodopila sp. TaxID=2480087 RepID=UPI003D0C25D9